MDGVSSCTPHVANKSWIREVRAAAVRLGLECDHMGQLTCKRCEGGMGVPRGGRIGATGREHRGGLASVLAPSHHGGVTSGLLPPAWERPPASQSTLGLLESLP